MLHVHSRHPTTYRSLILVNSYLHGQRILGTIALPPLYFHFVTILLAGNANSRARIATQVIDAKYSNVYWFAIFENKLSFGTLLAPHYLPGRRWNELIILIEDRVCY